MAERAFPAASVASFGGGRVIASPFQFATTDDDNLQIVSANSLPGVVLTIQGRRFNEKGTIEAFSWIHVPSSDRTTTAENFKLGGGALLNLVIYASSGSPKIGQTYVSARMIRGLSGATLLLGALLGGYVTAAQPLAYPGSPIESSIAGGGVPRVITGTDPAAGQEFLETVPTGARWQLLAVTVSLTSSAVVTDRRSGLLVISNGVTLFRSPQTTTQAASLTRQQYWHPGAFFNPAILSDVPIAPLPQPLMLQAGDIFKTNTNNLDAADNYSAPTYTVREWLEVQS